MSYEKVETIDRKLLYYYIKNNTQSNLIPQESLYDIFKGYKEIQDKKISENDEEYLTKQSPTSKNKKLLLEVTYIDEYKAECILSAIKKDVLPYIYGKDKKKKEIDVGMDESLLEMIHFTIFFKNDILVSEYDRNIASVSQVRFLIACFLEHRNLEIEPIINVRNINKNILDSETRSIEFSIPSAYTGDFSECTNMGVDDLGENLKALLDNNNFKISIKISANTPRQAIALKNNRLVNGILKYAKLIRSRKNNNELGKSNEKLKIAVAKDEKHKQAIYDLIEDKFFSEINAIAQKGNKRYIDSEDMFKKIEESYKNNLSLITNK